MGGSKNWCWTLNNYTDAELESLQTLVAKGIALYVIYGKEVGKSGTKHLQGFISFGNRKKLGGVKQILGSRAHIESARATNSQAANYCKKDGEFTEFGELPQGSGCRTDLVAVAEQCRDGTSFREIAETDPSSAIRYGTGILRLKQLYRPTRLHPPTIWTFWGKTGTGKTRRVWEFADLEELWVSPGSGTWFDGYDGHASVLFDDFDGSYFKLSYLLRILDRYVFQVPVKGAFAWWAPTTIYITSNINPAEWYVNANEEHKRALMRRLTENGTIQECK